MAFINQGWQCPNCKGCYSPTTPQCYNCTGKYCTGSSTQLSAGSVYLKDIKWPEYEVHTDCQCDKCVLKTGK